MRSRGNGDYADRVLAALRNQFGGHAVKSAPGENGAKPSRKLAKPATGGAKGGRRGGR